MLRLKFLETESLKAFWVGCLLSGLLLNFPCGAAALSDSSTKSSRRYQKEKGHILPSNDNASILNEDEAGYRLKKRKEKLKESELQRQADIHAFKKLAEAEQPLTKQARKLKDLPNPFLDQNSREYLLGNGDVVSINIWNHPELSGEHTIGPDGLISLPLIQNISLTGKTRKQAALAIQEQYLKLYPGISCTLSVSQYQAYRVYVLGKVRSPGVYIENHVPKLLEILSRAGGIASREREAITGIAIIRGREALAWIDLHSLLQEGQLALNIDLHPGDVVYIPDAIEKPIFVLGEVSIPGPKSYRSGISFSEVLANAGGVTRHGAASKIVLIRPSLNKKVILSLKDITEPRPELDLTLRPGDIIFVKPNFLSKFNYVVSSLNPFSWFFFATGRTTAPGVDPQGAGGL